MILSIESPGWLLDLAKPGLTTPGDTAKMELVVSLARENVNRGGGPFAAAVYHLESQTLVAAGVNLVLSSGLSVFHAEVAALSLAQRAVGHYSLATHGGHELFASSEPCAMCLGAILWSGVTRVVFAAPSKAARDIGFDEGPVFQGSWDYLRRAGIKVSGGILADKAAQVLLDYKRQGGVIYNPLPGE